MCQFMRGWYIWLLENVACRADDARQKLELALKSGEQERHAMAARLKKVYFSCMHGEQLSAGHDVFTCTNPK